MAEEGKDPKACEASESKSCACGKTILKYLIGIALIVGGALLLWNFKKDFYTLVLGCIGPFLLLAGAITIAIAKE